MCLWKVTKPEYITSVPIIAYKLFTKIDGKLYGYWRSRAGTPITISDRTKPYEIGKKYTAVRTRENTYEGRRVNYMTGFHCYKDKITFSTLPSTTQCKVKLSGKITLGAEGITFQKSTIVSQYMEILEEVT